MTKKEKAVSKKEETRMLAFMKAQQDAERIGHIFFACPLCGGEAYWLRNYKHMSSRCRDCGFSIIS